MHTLYQGDCLEVMPLLAAASVDLVLCDLPYGTTQNKWDSIISLDKLWREYSRIIKSDRALIFTLAQPFTSNLVMAALPHFRQELIWYKNIASNFLNANRQHLACHESILVFAFGSCPFFPQEKSGKSYLAKRLEKDDSGDALMEYLIKTYTNEGDTVLDNCMGSGTTGVACINTGREFIGIEQDPSYFQIAKNRIEEAEFQKAIDTASRMG